ncbi:prolyl oligopeptidase family serine peptidase [Streptococcus saliviloxodontae]|uniref:prolyl oligopeptidase family serine peptidase n=1 Tax=Streptococcus saliviloxodontae TaxID=1349416 RepID=UPI0019603679|nr:prolyl oligopeptidase family serine peptidase [Streptococcus saliviloxodontae]
MKRSLSQSLVITFLGGVGLLTATSYPVAAQESVSISDTAIVIQGYEFGPAVPKIVLTLDHAVSSVSKEGLKVETAGVNRQVQKVYLSDKDGDKIDKSSRYITIQMPVTFNTDTNAAEATPFSYNMETYQNNWVTSYPVSVYNLQVTSNKKTVALSSTRDAISNRRSKQLEVFNDSSSYSGTYTNPLTQDDEELRLNYAAYEPKKLVSGAKNPLIIWLHGQGEGGTDTDITLLGNEVTALTSQSIQSHFKSGKQSGAYVLAVQAPTYWMDEGDGTNGAGAGKSRYTEILMDTIKDYVAKHPDVDSNRIYLTGGSNGGYMTLNLAIQNPGYFAALVPQAAAYSYYQYERNADGTYVTVPSDTSLSGAAFVPTDQVNFDQEQIAALKDTPIWFIHASNDSVVDPSKYALPVYKALVDSGASNKWMSYYESVEGSDMKGVSYMGHWSWLYFFNDRVSGVQNTDTVKTSSGLAGFSPDNKNQGGRSQVVVGDTNYHNIFDWMNAQEKKE